MSEDGSGDETTGKKVNLERGRRVKRSSVFRVKNR